MAYSKLAYVYDVLMEDAPYDEWQYFVNHFVSIYHPSAKKLLDLGCGTGQMSRRFDLAGYQVTGLDYSEDMLAYAKSTSAHIPYILQDIRYMNDLAGFDVVVSLCDVINYITSEAELLKVFNNVYNSLSDKGLFIFDVHSLRHLEEDLIGGTFAEIYADISYVWLCERGDNSGSVEHDLTFFILDENSGKYERFDEKHQQRTFSATTYLNIMEMAGFKSLGVYGDFSVNTAENPEEKERIFFVCQK